MAFYAAEDDEEDSVLYAGCQRAYLSVLSYPELNLLHRTRGEVID
jgi:hypothetical protein